MLGQKIQVTVSSGNFPVIPMDKYTVQIYDVMEKTKTFGDIEETGLNYELVVLDNKTTEFEGEIVSLRGQKLWHWVSNKVSTRSKLGKLIAATLGRDLTNEELDVIRDEGFGADELVGKQIDVMVQVVDGTGKNAGRQFSNVISVAKCSKELTPFDPKSVEDLSEKELDELFKEDKDKKD